MKRTILKVNSEIKGILKSKNIALHDGLLYLLGIYYGLTPSYIPLELEKRILSCNILSKEYVSGTTTWKVPLFEETITGYEWIGDWMNLFKQVNPERRGVKRDVLTRMKKFFVNNPSIRKQEVEKATRNYLNTIKNPKYCKKSHKFIYELDGTSMLLDYVEQLHTTEKRVNAYKGDII